jgi:hypothetical protein
MDQPPSETSAQPIETMKQFLPLLAIAVGLVAASSTRAAGADDVLRINHAVEVEHDTVPGHSYVLQSSTNLTDWTDLGEPEPGHGGRDRKLFSAREDNGVHRFYRVRVMDGPTNGVAPWSVAGWRFQMDDEPGGELMDFLGETNGADLSEGQSAAFAYEFRRTGENEARADIVYSATRSNVLTYSFATTNAGTWLTEEYRNGRLKNRHTGLFRVLGDLAGTLVVVSTNGAAGGGATASEPPAPPASLAGLLYYFQAIGVPDQYGFSDTTAGVEIQGVVSEGSPTNGFVYTYTVLSTNTASLVMKFGYYGAGGDRYEIDLVFTDGPSGHFVRRQYRRGTLKNTDTGVFSPTGLAGSNGGTVTPITDIAVTNPPPVSPAGLTYTMLSGAVSEHLVFQTATGVQHDDSAPTDFTYTYAATGADTFSLVVQFKADRWNEYDLNFIDGAHGMFVRRQFQNGVLKGTNAALFIIATSAP